LQFLAPTSAEPPISSGVLEDGSPLTIDGKIETTIDIAELSLIVGSVPVGAAAQPTPALLIKVKISVLVATRLQRYSQTMVWDIPVDESTSTNVLLC
jgi:hypothetical protein